MNRGVNGERRECLDGLEILSVMGVAERGERVSRGVVNVAERGERVLRSEDPRCDKHCRERAERVSRGVINVAKKGERVSRFEVWTEGHERVLRSET